MAESAATVAALAKLGVAGPFDLGIVLGTGLGPLADDIEDPVKVSYADIPGFPAGHVSGHAKQLVAGRLAGKRVVTLNGRAILDVDLDEAMRGGTRSGKDHPGARRASGHVGFLGHGDRVEYRDIRILELPAAAAAQTPKKG